MATKAKKVKIRQLGVGAVFAFERLDSVADENKIEFWKIIGRPTYGGQRNPATKKKEYVVLATYVKKNKEDQNTQPEKSFNIDYEVVLVKNAGKDPQAIDQRDQPRVDGKPAVTPLSELRKELGEDLEPDLADDDSEKSLDDFIKDDEEEESQDD